jgi:hypothetical protein
VRPSSRLDHLADTAARRALALRQLVIDRNLAPRHWTHSDQRVVSYAVIEAANLWEGYCRAFYISSAMRARDASGRRVQISPSSPIRTIEDAITVAVHRIAPDLRSQSGPWEPRDEPDWSLQLGPCLREVGASNLPKFERAVGFRPEARNDLRTLRNFFAHKGEGTAVKVQALTGKYGVRGSPCPMDFVLSSAKGRAGYQPGEMILLRWLGALYRALRLTVEPTAGSP